MKKMNNKGFAISSLLYGLMLVAFLTVGLLMSIMSTNRKNTNTLVKKIEEELNRYSQTATEITATTGAQEFIVPYGKAGWYKIELWGAASADVDASSETEEGRGSYTSGIIYLEENAHLYFQIGTQGGSNPANNNTNGDSGGGATDVRLLGGNWNDENGLKSRIMVAGGGNGSGYYSGYKNNSNGNSYISGYDISAADDPLTDTDSKFINAIIANGVNTSSGKAKIELVSTNDRNNPPARKNPIENNVRYIKDCVKSNEELTTNYSRWKEIVAIDINGNNVAKEKTATINGNAILKITDESKESFTDGSTHSKEITHCVIVDLGEEKKLEKIVIFHNKAKSIERYISEEVSVSLDNVNYSVLESWTSQTYSPHSTEHGLSISFRNYNGEEGVLTGNYYIYSVPNIITGSGASQQVGDQNKVITAKPGYASKTFNSGQAEQIWAITKTEDNFYSITETAGSRTLKKVAEGEAVKATPGYEKNAWEEWNIVGLKNGYYKIKSRDTSDGELCMGVDPSGNLITSACFENVQNQWFKLVNADY